MKITRPRQESFNMAYEELMAFWFIIIPEYSHKEVRAKSLLIYNNSLVRSDGDAGQIGTV